MRFTAFIFLCSALGLFADSIKASPTCVTNADASTLNGVTCDIGPLTFTFKPFVSYGVDETYTFTPLANGFSLTSNALIAAESATSVYNGSAFEYAYLPFSVTDQYGNLTGIGVSGGMQTASSIGTTGNGTSLYLNEICTQNSCSVAELYTQSVRGSTSTSSYYVNPPSGQLSTYPNDAAYPIYLFTNDIGTATSDGATTNFTFDATNLSATPEPGTMLLFGTGLIALLKVTRRKLSE